MKKHLLVTNLIWIGVAVYGCGPMSMSGNSNLNGNQNANTDGENSVARIRVVHASPDAPGVDVCANGGIVFENATFFGATNYLTVGEGSYTVKVVPTGSGCDSEGVIEAELVFGSGTDTTIAAINELENIQPIVLADDNTTPETGMVAVRFVHASPDAPTVDITLDDGTTLFDDISFSEDSDYIMVAAGTYDLDVRDMTGQQTVLDVDGVELEQGNVYTIWATGFLESQPTLVPEITVDN